MNYLIVMPATAPSKKHSYFFPIGMAYVSAALKQTGRPVFTYNLNYKDGTVEENLSKVIKDNDIDVIMTGGLTQQYHLLLDILTAARKISPEIITCVGGGIITSSPVDAMKALEIADYGMVGEGEITICELADALEGKKDFSAVDGLVYMKNGDWVLTAPRGDITDLDSLPFPDYEGFEYEKLLDAQPLDLCTGFGRTGYVCFSRSCPFNCTFCFHPSGTKYRRRSSESIFKEIDYLIEKYGIKSISIGDELFASNINEVRDFCKKIKQRGILYEISLRVDMVNREMLELLRDSGCVSIGFGLESANNAILASMKKHITIEQIEHALNLCNEVGIPACGNFIFGDPAENYETAMSTIRWWKAHPQFSIKLVMLLVFPGTQVFNAAVSKGVIKDTVKYIKDGCPYINTSQMTDAEYREIAIMTGMLARELPDRLTDAALKYEYGGRVTLTGRCPECGCLNEWTNLEAFRSINPLICKQCNHTVDSIPVNYLTTDIIQKNWEKLSARKTAIWPAIPAVSKFFEKVPEAAKCENLFLIDKSTVKQGGNFMGKTVYPPDIISKENIDTVIISFTSQITREITDEIDAFYPSVKNIIFLGELLNDDFSFDTTD